MNKKVKVSVVNPSKTLSLIAVGSKITFEQDPKKYPFDQFAVRAIYSGDEIGLISASANTSAIGCVLNNEIHPLLNNGSIEGVVVGHDKVNFKNGLVRTVLVVEIKIKTKEKEKDKNILNYVCKLKGSTRSYKGKIDVFADFQAGKSVFVTLSKDGDNIIANYNGKTAGIVDEKKSKDTTDFEKILEVVSVMGSINAKVTDLGGADYAVEFEMDKQRFGQAKLGKKVLTLEEVKNDIVSNNICSMDTLDEIQKFLILNSVSRKQIIDVFLTYKKYEKQYQSRIPKRPKTLFQNYDGLNLIKKCVIYINKGKFLRFVGEKGTGKNNLVTTLAWIFQRPLYEVSLNRDFDKLDIVGSKILSVEGNYKEITEPTVVDKGMMGWLKSLNTIIIDTANTFLNKTTKVTFDKEALIEAMEIGAIINYDEVNTCDPALLVMLHSITDSRRSIQVPGYGRVVAEKNFNIILTMNREYQGTVNLNEATIDRFVPIVFPSRNSIIDLLHDKFPNVEQEELDICDGLYKGILDQIKDGELSMDCMTVRGFIDALDVIDDFDIKEALNDNIANRIEDEEYRQKVLNMIDDLTY